MADFQFDASIVPKIDPSQLSSGISQIQQQFEKLKLPKDLQTKMSDLFGGAAQEAEKFQSILNGKFRTKKDLFGLEKAGDSAVAELEKIRTEMDKISETDLAASIDTSTEKFRQLDQQIEQLDQKISQAFNIDDEVGQTGQKIKEVVSSAITELEKISKAKVLGKDGENDFSKALLNEKDASAATQELLKMIEVINNFKDAQVAAIPEIQAFKTALQAGKYQDAIDALESIKDNAIALGKSGHTVGEFATQMKTLTEQTKALSESNLDSFIQKKKELEESKQLTFTNELERAKAALEQGKINLDQYTASVKKYVTEQQQAKQSQMNFNSEIDQLKSRVQYFFGLTNAVQLFRRALQSTFNTVKELDASMTETAVVTDFTVSDMWEQLPQYTATAKEFGVTIKGVYDVMTLYYQQGLDQNTAWQLGTETLKLARIAGLDYAEATDRMTNALRGFNMELNEQNAQRVDDVYSKLAAMSASNVDELSIAMTKTASIAKSANMEFETTAAFLAQIIETTREAPETAGTALKTVIARFSEVKELYTKGQLTGEDSEGEAIDVNKVSKALKTAGVDMNKYFLGEVGLDDIFIELASKWDSLDLVQQRYIATQAAGSRQQSRFIAMLSDYSRTLELVEGAENSAGASQSQFEKTQESLENKLNRLKDTWQEFLMGIANSSAIKTGIDLLNGLLTIVNKLTTGFGPLSNSILKVGAAILTLKGGGAILSKGLGMVGSVMGMAKGADKAGQFAQPQTWIGRMKERGRNFVAANQSKENAAGFAAFRTNAELEQYNNQKLSKKNEYKEALGIKKREPIQNASQGESLASSTALTVDTAAAEADAEAEKKVAAAKTATGQSAQQEATELQQSTTALNAEETEQIRLNAAKDEEVAKRITAGEAAQTEIEAKQAAALSTVQETIANSDFIVSEETIASVQSLVAAGIIDENSAKEAAEVLTLQGVGANGAYATSEEALSIATKLAKEGIITEAQAEAAANAITEEGVAANLALASAETATGSAAAGATGPIAAMGAALYASFGPLLPIILAVGAAIGVVVAATKGIQYAMDHTESAINAAAVGNAQEAVKRYSEEADKAEQSISTLESSWEELTNTNNDLSNLIPGTEAFTKKVLEANQQVLQLLEQFNGLSQYLSIDSTTGLMSINQEGYESILKQQQDNLKLTQVSKTYAMAQATQAQAKLDYDAKKNKAYSKFYSSSPTKDDGAADELYNSVFGETELGGRVYYDTNRKSWYAQHRYKDAGGKVRFGAEAGLSLDEQEKLNNYLTTEGNKSSIERISDLSNAMTNAQIDYNSNNQLATNEYIIAAQMAGNLKDYKDSVYETTNAILQTNGLPNQSTFFRKGSGSIYDVLQVDNDTYRTGKTNGGVAKAGTQASKWLTQEGNENYLVGLGLTKEEVSSMSNMDLYAKLKGWTYENSSFMTPEGEVKKVGHSKDITKEQVERELADMISSKGLGTIYDELATAVANGDENLRKFSSGDFTTDLNKLDSKYGGFSDEESIDNSNLSTADKTIAKYYLKNKDNFDKKRQEANEETSSNINNIFDNQKIKKYKFVSTTEPKVDNGEMTVAEMLGDETISAISQGKQEISSMLGLKDNGNLAALYERYATIGSLGNIKSDENKIALAQSIFGEDLSLDELNTKIDESTHRAESLKDYIGNINFNDAIGGAKQLKTDLEAGGKAAENALAISQSTDAFDAVAQVTQLMSGENWGDISSNLTSIYNSIGSINSDNVRELTSQYGDLGQMLDNGTMTASSFSAMMEDVAQGELSLADITNDLIGLYNGFYGALDLAGDAMAEFNKHQIRESRTGLGRGYTDSWAAVQDLIEKGAWGDVQMGDYMAQLVGTDTWDAALLEYGSQKEAVTNLNRLYGFDQNKGNLQGSWQHLLNTRGDNGAISFSSGGGMSLGADGQIAWDLTGIESSADLINQIAEAFGVSDEYAKALVGDMQTFSENFRSQLAELDSGAAITNYLNSHLSEDGTLKGSKAELSALARKLGGKDATVDDLPTLLNGKVKKKTKDENGNEIEENQSVTKAKVITRKANGFVEEEEDEQGNKIQHVNASKKDIAAAGKIERDVQAYGRAVNPYETAGAKNKQDAAKMGMEDALKIPAIAQIIAADAEDVPNKEELLNEMGFTDGALISELLSDDAVAAAQAKTATMASDMTQTIASALDSITALLNEQSLELKVGGGFGLDANFIGKSKIGKLFDGSAGKLEFKPDGGTIEISANPSSYGSVASSYSAPSSGDSGDYEYTGDGTGNNTGKSTYGKNDDTGSGGGGGGGSSGDGENEYTAEEYQAFQDENKTFFEESVIGQAITDGFNQAVTPYDTFVGAAERLAIGDFTGANTMIQDYQAQLADQQNLSFEDIVTSIKDEGATISQLLTELVTEGKLNNETLAKLPGAGSYFSSSNLDPKVANSIVQSEYDAYQERKSARDNRISRYDKIGSKTQTNVGKLIVNSAKTIEFAKDTMDVLPNALKARSNFEKQWKEAPEKYKKNYDVDPFTGQMSKNKNYTALGTAGQKESDDAMKNVLSASESSTNFMNAGFDSVLNLVGGVQDVFSAGKGIYDTMKGYAEKIAQYITQAIEVVVSAWTNRKDWLYNFLNRIEKELHEFEKLQEYANQIDEGRVVTYQELIQNWDDQFESLQKQLEMQNERIESRQQYLDWSKFIPFTIISGWSPVTDTLYENRTVKFMWDLMIGFGQMMPMFGDVFKSLDELYQDYDKRVQENYEDRLEAEKAILEIETERLKLVKAGAEEATQFEEKVMDAFIQKEQEAIDELSRLNEAITGANQTLIDTLKNNLDEVRRIRENTDTEEELTDKETRLAYLRQDTSNANQNEIKKLEKELEKANESYTDKLIDQRITDLQKQNDLAADQRQKQIDLLQGQLDWAEKYGVYWDHIYGMLYTVDEYGNIGLNQENFDERGFLRANSELSKMLNTFSDLIGESIWKTLMDNEELKKLGVYYNAFIQYNGNEGIWRRQDMLQNPDINDNGYVSWWTDKNAGPFWQFFAKIEDDWHDFWINNDLGLWNDVALVLKKVADVFLKIWGWITGQTFESRAEAWKQEGGFKSERDNNPFTRFWFALFTGQFKSLPVFNRAADGTDSASAGKWLVGEEGPELIQFANGGAYLAGTHGPEMVNLSNGDKVYNNSDTKGIFGRGPSFGRLAEGNTALAFTEPKWIEDLVERGIKQLGNLTKSSNENNRTVVNEVHINIDNMNGNEDNAEYVAQVVIDRLDEVAKYRSTNYIDHASR